MKPFTPKTALERRGIARLIQSGFRIPRGEFADMLRRIWAQSGLKTAIEFRDYAIQLGAYPVDTPPEIVQGREIELQLLRETVSQTPEYNAAPWGTDSRQKRRPDFPISKFGAAILRILNSETGETIPRALLLECGIQCGAIDPPPATLAPEFFDELATFEECTPTE